MMNRNSTVPLLALLIGTVFLSVPPTHGQVVKSAGTATAPERFFICDGFNRSLDQSMRRYIALYVNHALIDGIEYRITANDLFYSLEGPPLPGTEMLGPEIRFRINRLTGGYEVTPLSTQSKGIMTPEWSRAEDRGCVAVERRL